MASFLKEVLEKIQAQWLLFFGVLGLLYGIYQLIIYPFYLSPLAKVPGPKLCAITKWYMVLIDFSNQRTVTLHKWHRKYGNIVRVGPNELAFSGDEPMKVIYGAGTLFSKPAFYNLFIAYGTRPMFAMLGNIEHGERRKTVSNTYAKSYVLSPAVEKMMQGKIKDFMDRIGSQLTSDVFPEFHFLGLDVITAHVYGPDVGTKALKRVGTDHTVLDDFIRGSKSAWMWSLVHFPEITERASTPGDILNKIATTVGILRKTALPYTGARKHTYDSTIKYLKEAVGTEDISVMSKMIKYHVSQGGDWSDAELAAEASDHTIAGADTTAETLTMLLWQISRPGFQHIQDKLREELNSIQFNTDGIPPLRPIDKLPYLNAVINEGLRYYPAIPMSEPRVLEDPSKEVSIYGYKIPTGTICSMQPYTENRIPEVFTDPDKFDPGRWMIPKESDEYRAMNRMMWTFSSGGRMCIGLHVAVAQMQMVLAAIYHKYNTRVSPKTTDESMKVLDQITSAGPQSHHCYIEFHPVN